MLQFFSRRLCVLALLITSLSVHGHDVKEVKEAGFVSIFDGKTLEGWTAARSTGAGDWGAFSVNEKEEAIHVYAGREAGSKQTTDCLVTLKQYSHFILKLEYKWLGKRFAPRTTWDRDAGLLFHVHGDLKRVWPFCLEMQIGESPGDKKKGKEPTEKRFHTGDLFVLGKHLFTQTPRKGNLYHADAESQKGKSVMTSLGIEKPHGEWNKMEIHVHGSEKAIFILNGEVVLETTNFTQEHQQGGPEEEGGERKITPLSLGHLGLQAEWAELLYRKIRIKELK